MKVIMTVLLIAICLGMAISAQAQLKFGVKGGVNLAKVDFNKSDLKSDNTTGFFIGPMAEFNIPIVGLGIDGSLLFSQKGFKSNSSSSKQYGLDIPVNLKYTIGLGSMLGIFITAGPDFYFDFSKIEANIERNRAQVGINVGAGIKLIKHLQLGVNYNIPMGNSFTWENAGKAIAAKTKTWQFSAAVLF